ncbi:MAG: T9SS type A sorting domain-containing protein [Candidatus Krumholzibacteria bacterium]|nr:T9SS type A sorting domain-containing protein [Candidatus Krumholzibacteria bacterium]MDH4337654.1 T9SS type A sorting domain-containing protein [Candidatus Krumholzibacteria bacterium]MDH5270266.1 T9SS type A sorting domain-containing protein [Candidatus Krumholzibacteria bacterium]
MKRFPVAVVVALLLLFTVNPAEAAKFISGTIASNTTLDTVGGRVYQVTGPITVNPGVTLTISPGVVLKFNLNTYMTVNGKIVAAGGSTPDSLIYFTSIRDDNAPAPAGEDTNGDGGTTTPANSNWYYVYFTAGSDDTSILKHCVLRYGGAGATGMVLCQDASPTLEDCDLSAAYYGVRCNGASKPIIRDTSINAMTDVPIAIEIQADPVLDNLAFGSTQDNGFDALGLLGGTLTGANTLRIRGATLGVTPIPNLVYILISDFTVANGGSLTIQPGVVVKPKAGVNVLVQGTLTMDGTANPDSQIVFTSFKDDTYGNPNDTNNDGSISAPARGDWGQIEFQPGSSGSVSRAIIKFGGSNSAEGVIRCMNVSPPISDCLISDTYFGIEQKGTASSVITNVTISNCAKTPIYMSTTANPTFAGLTFNNNTLTALGIINETVSTNSVLKVRNVAGYNNITYWLSGTLTIAGGSRLRVEPGVVVKVDQYYMDINIDGALTADAKPESLIVFTSRPDDAWGNPADTENNGGATVPAPNNWGHIKFSATSNDAQCILDNCVLSYGGYDPLGAYRGVVWCNSASPTITNCQFKTNTIGITTDGNSAPTIATNDFFNHSSVPLATSVVSDPQYSLNTFSQNAYHAVGILPETLSQNARLEKIFVGGPPQFSQYFPYMHLGTLTIGTAAKLTIDAGVVVKVLSGNPITVNGALDMLGKSIPDSIIVYTSIHDDSKGGDSNVNGSSTSPSAGNWSSIQFNSTATASLIEHSLFRFGGSNYVIRMASASPTIRNCEFEINTWGLWIQNTSNPVVQNNLFRLTTYLPASCSIIANPVFSGNTLDNNGYDALGMIGESLGQDATVHKRNFAGYSNITRILVGGSLNVNFGVTLTIDAGIVLKMGRIGYEPFNGFIGVDGALDVNGTLAEPVVFTSSVDDEYGNPPDTNNDGALSLPAAGNWQYIEFRDVSTDANNILQHCLFRYGGYNSYAIRIVTAGPTFQDCTFYRNNSYAIRIEGASNPVINACVFDYHTITPVQMSLISNPSFVGANQFNPTNTYRAIGVIGETLAQDVLWKRRSVGSIASVPYVLTGNLTAGLSSILRIQPGVVIKPTSGVGITVQRGLIAEGKALPESLIVFTSPRDDFYGGDTNNDSTLTNGSSLRWGSIQIANEAIDDSTRFSYCVFRYATNSSTIGAVNVTSAHPDFNRCIFQQNGVGVNFNGAAGDSTKGKIERCDFLDNTYYGVKNTGLSFVVSAKNSWWGDASGPLDNSDDTSTGGWYNPTGLGDPVTNKVDYTGWKTGGVQNLLLGDVSLNGEVRAFDASLVLQHLALLITLSAQQQTIGDVNCSNVLSTLDASFILRYVAGLLSYFPCALAGPEGSPALPVVADGLYLPGSGHGNFDVRLPAFTLEPANETTVRVEVGGDGELLGHEYHFEYDPNLVEVAGVRLTKDAEGAMLYWKADTEGHLHVAVAAMDLLPVKAAVELVLRPRGNPADGTRVAFDFTRVVLNEQNLTDVALSDGGTVNVSRKLPGEFALMQNRPNPFNPTTTIEYAIPASASSLRVSVSVFDVAGRLVRTLVDRTEAPGLHSVVWDGRDDRGVAVSSGVYFYRINAGSFRADRKMVLLK